MSFRSASHCIASAIATSLLATCVICSAVSNFVPVYGSIPIEAAWGSVQIASILLGSLGVNLGLDLGDTYVSDAVCGLICIWTAAIVPVQRLWVFPHSANQQPWLLLSMLLGPLLALFTHVTVRLATNAVLVSRKYDHPNKGSAVGNGLLHYSSIVVSLLTISALMWIIPATTSSLAANFPDWYIQILYLVSSRIWLQLALGIVCTSWYSLIARHPKSMVIALSYYFLAYAAFDTLGSREQRLLEQEGYRIIERKESVTGYVSVIENTQQHFRALRCDHSLLGGQWELTQERIADGILIPESIYSVFYTLEAVRLIQATSEDLLGSVVTTNGNEVLSETSSTALVIGLGIGTAPNALASHGLNVTAVEIDPIITDFAVKYFSLNSQIHTVTQDAIDFTGAAMARNETYDYIIHDVFTGGAEPTILFGEKFLHGLRKLLKSRGSIALNYAGDLNSRSTYDTIERIIDVFQNCRVYRDRPSRDGKSEFVNIMVFCMDHDGPWKFRRPIETDFLRSQTRKDVLLPRHEVDMEIYRKKRPQLRKNDRVEDAREHWRIMRAVIPHVVWENW